MIFRKLILRNWRQFSSVDLDFHPRLTVLTGANGAGKTTILHLLNRHWGWDIPYVSSPRRTKRDTTYWAGFWQEDASKLSENTDSSSDLSKYPIGLIDYDTHPSSELFVPRDVSETFSVEIKNRPNLKGVYVPSHRPLYNHQKVSDIPTTVDARQQIFNVYMQEIQKQWGPSQRITSPSFMLKRSLISLSVFGYGNPAVQPNRNARETFEGYEHVLRQMLPASLGFRKLVIQAPDVLMHTSTGRFPIDAASGGISALLDISWQVYLYSTLADDFVVVIDEPETHLHPELQRLVLPNLIKAFPQAQFIVATHNPLVVSSVEESFIYVLRYDDQEKVFSEILDQVNKSGTANEILREVLGLDSTSALWVEQSVSNILQRYMDRELSDELLNDLRSDLREAGLARYLPRALDTLGND